MPKLKLPSTTIPDEILWQIPTLVFHVLSHTLRGEPDLEGLRTIATEHLVERDWLHTLAVMCSPDDPVQVARCDEALASEDLYIAAKSLAEGPAWMWSRVDCTTLISVADRENPREVLSSLTSGDLLAKIACGYVLRRIISLHQSGRISTVAEAAEVIEEFYRKNRLSGGKTQNIVRNKWKRYRSVSHLWAAWSIIQDSGFGDKAIPEWFPFFCGTAQWLLEQGIAIRRKGAKTETILSADEAWEMPASRVSRSSDGSIQCRLWNEDPDEHDIRAKSMPPSFPGR